jgi:hypothetical protein
MTDEKSVSVSAILALMSGFAVRSRGLLSALGRKILAYGKSSNLDTRKAIHDSLETAAKLAGSTFDSALFSRALSCAADFKTAQKNGVLDAWKDASSDKDAQAILDKATGKIVKVKSKKSDVQKAIAAIDKIEDSAAMEYVALHVAKLLESMKNAESVETPAETEAVAA